MKTDTALSLAEQLADVAKKMSTNLPPEQLKIFGRVIDELKNSGIAHRALMFGSKIPPFRLRSSDGRWISSSDLLTKGPLVIVFYRGGWCPFCSLELRAWEAHQEDLQALGVSFVAISPEVPERAVETIKSQHLSFPLLVDEGAHVAEKFGLVFKLSPEATGLYRDFGVDLPAINGEPEWRLPMPATYVVGRDGMIIYSFVEVDHTKRAEPADVLNVFRFKRLERD